MARQKHDVSWEKVLRNAVLAVRKFTLLFSICGLLTACAATSGSYANLQPPPPSSPVVTLKPGDQIEIKFRFWPDLNDTQVIRPDGMISLQLVDDVKVAGLTPKELDDKLTSLYASKLKNPEITVIVRSLADQRYYVGGEVANPGLVTMQGKVDVLQAVISAGGLKETASPQSVIVIRKGQKGKPVPYRVNLKNCLYRTHDAADFILQPNDIVYVPKSFIANADQFVDQYIAKLLLVRGVGLGFNYELHSANNNTRTITAPVQ